MKFIFTLLGLIGSLIIIHAQSSLSGILLDNNSEPIEFANVVLYKQSDNKMIKVTTSDEDGKFVFKQLPHDTYRLETSFIGFESIQKSEMDIDMDIVLDPIVMKANAVALETAVIKARRSIVEVKPDRLVFNVEGTINSAGDNALGLLKKAPSVTVDNNDNISVLSRSGVIIYVDGKRLPLSGDDLTSYLQNIPAEQIDRMDIITNPGAKYEAEGNAGIIDIRLKKDKSIGANGSISGNLTKATFIKGNVNVTGNYRNKVLNTFGNVGYADGTGWMEIHFLNKQNGIITNENDNWENRNGGLNYRVGTDFFIHKNHTIGFLYSGRRMNGKSISDNELEISMASTPLKVDSVLIAKNSNDHLKMDNSFNINYAFGDKKHSLNIDLDYGRYRNEKYYWQPNRYYNPQNNELLSEVLTEYETPIDIDISTAKLDYETKLWGGKLGLGGKVSKVSTDNTFLFSDILNDKSILNNQKSNRFKYDEQVIAEYFSYTRSINNKWSFSSGLRVETTNATGNLTAFDTTKSEAPLHFDYTSFFPNAGLTYQIDPMKVLSLNYGRRINRPDYNVLNPFRVQISELSFSKGNAFLKPEIVNNIELGFTLNYRYNFKISYSNTSDQITRLIGADDIDPRAGYITWDNLAKQEVYSANISAPLQFKSWWNAYFNISASYINNQADYGNGAVVDIQAFNYNLYQQQTFTLPNGFTGEVSGYYAGPGVWGGVFLYDKSWSLNLGLQKKFLQDNLSIKLSVNDIFKTAGWKGTSVFAGLVGSGEGYFDSRKAAISASYNFGNNKVKSRKRKTGIEEEEKRVGQ